MSRIVITIDSKDIEYLLKGWPVQMDCNRNHDYRNLCGVEIHTEMNIPPKIKNLVEVTRCKDCMYYLPNDKLREFFKYRKPHNPLNQEGFCTNIDKWVNGDFFCASGCEKSDKE